MESVISPNFFRVMGFIYQALRLAAASPSLMSIDTFASGTSLAGLFKATPLLEVKISGFAKTAVTALKFVAA